MVTSTGKLHCFSVSPGFLMSVSSAFQQSIQCQKGMGDGEQGGRKWPGALPGINCCSRGAEFCFHVKRGQEKIPESAWSIGSTVAGVT